MVSTIRGSALSDRMDSSETLKECTPLSYHPRDTSMLLETAELFHSWEESPDEDEEDKTYTSGDATLVPSFPQMYREKKLLSNFSSSSIQNTSSGSVPLPFNGWQSSCDTTAHERPLSKLSIFCSVDEGDEFQSRKQSNVSQGVVIGPTSRHSSLVLHPQHRRQFSGGSKVSFQEGVIQCGSVLSSHMGSHVLGSRFGERANSMISDGGLSDSIHVTCQRCNLEAFKNIRKPDIEEVKENLRKVPPLAIEG